MMKKKALFATAALSAAMIALVMTGCQAGLVTSNLSMNEDGSGTKTITCEILGDNSVIPGTEDSTVGNNSKYLLVYGDALAEKVKSYSALEDIEVTATENEAGDTILTLSYSFANIEEYNTKTKTLAKDDASLIQDATFTQSGTDADGNTLYTLREYTDNTLNSVSNLFESLFNDETAFDTSGGGDFELDAPAYGYTSIFAVMSISLTIGDTTETTTTYEYSDPSSGAGDYIDSPEWTEVTGTFANVGGGTDPGTDDGNGGSNVGLIVGCTVAAVVVVAAAVAAIVIVNKKKKNTPKSDE